ncbi:MAG: EAL domain-containing protein [gamma proteobacterium symbiont of Taylorina sp.]|nr:EAL domain-containing protein [gamma proteobacterium symbiont of Taylorina sp.]
MRLQTKVFVTTFIIFLLHFIVDTYVGQSQIKADVINNIKENARTIRGLLMSYRGVYQKIFINHHIPITDQTIEFLPAHAVSRISKDFTQWVDTGLTFNSVSEQPRNPDNKADSIELEAIRFFRQNEDEIERFVPFNNSAGEHFYHFSQPIIIKPRCIKCHGKKEDAPISIQQRYDTAYNYKIGDLRGIMSIKLPAEIIEQRSNELFKHNIAIHLSGMLFSFILIALLLNHTILSRIKILREGSKQLAEGLYDTQIQLSGHDELTKMGQTFNHMARTISQREQQQIKAKQQLEQSALQLSELNNKMRMLLESTGEGIFGVDLNGQCTFVNHAALEMFGFSLAELEGKEMHPLTHHTHKDGSEFHAKDCPIYHAFRAGQPRHINDDYFWRKDNSHFPVQYSAYPIYNDNWEISGTVVVFRDMTEQLAAADKISFLASHDPLTGLLNRYSFEQKLNYALQTVQFEEIQHAICYLDLDQFKVINDTCGHLAGDEMLKVVARLLQDNIRENDTLARLGGDEFGLILEQHSIEQAAELAQKICDSIKGFHFVWQDKIFNVGVSIGLTSITKETISAQSLMSAVDTACYVAKDKGRNQIHICQLDDAETAKHQDEMHWVSEIKKALEEDRFVIYKQAIIPSDPHHSENQHFEILIRMKDKLGNIIPPGAFLPAAEHYDLIGDIDRWVIQTSFKWLAGKQDEKETIDFCSINLSGQSIGNNKLYQFIIEQQEKWEIKPDSICFEITENAAITHIDQAISFINQLSEKGFLFALDDFGTGMSSFSYLKNLPVDFLKIDGSFVKDILDDPIDRAMIKSINEIGHILGLKTIAEYVENSSIQAELVAMKIDYLQGYGIEKPQPCD